MDNHINIQQGKTTYKIFDNRQILCTKSVSLFIFGEIKHFSACAWANCAKENTFNESFGKALAWIRASQIIGRQIETCLVKYSFDHFIGTKTQKQELITEINKLLKKLGRIK